jgi:hypothetical protein
LGSDDDSDVIGIASPVGKAKVVIIGMPFEAAADGDKPYTMKESLSIALLAQLTCGFECVYILQEFR